MLEINVHAFEEVDVMATYEGKSENYTDVDVNIYGEGLLLKATVKDVPYYDKDGEEISYEEALDFYGEEALEEDIWSDSDYLDTFLLHLYKGDYTVTTDEEVKIK